MMLKLLSVLLYCLRWLAWAFQYLIIWPAATLMLLIIMLFRMENSTPGKAMAQEIMAVTHNVSSSEFRIAACRDEPFEPFIPAVRQGKSPDLELHSASPALCHDRGSVITDANGYAGHVDGALSTFKLLWIVMAIVFSGAALLMGCHPYFCLSGQMRSARFRYGIPASCPAPATETVKKADNEKEGEYE